MSAQPAPAKPSASVVVLRDGASGLEVLMLKRNEQIAFHGGAWVFPGGRVDDGDRASASDSELDIAKRAAVRETLEETGLDIEPASMAPFAHWTTPVELPKRFATWFFYALYGGRDDVRIDHSEIVDHRWLAPRTALDEHARGDLTLPAPTFVTLLGLAEWRGLADARARLGALPIQRFTPRVIKLAGGRCTLYEEDAGYANGDFDAPGPRHRLIMREGDWRYVRDF